jgi:hypothetical protein
MRFRPPPEPHPAAHPVGPPGRRAHPPAVRAARHGGTRPNPHRSLRCAGLLAVGLLVAGRAARGETPGFQPFPLVVGGAGPQLGALAAGPADGRFLVTWYAPGEGALHARLFGRDGTAAGPDAVLAVSSSPLRAAAAYNGRTGEFLVVWQGGGALAHVYGQRIGTAGAPVGDVLSISSIYSAQGAPSAAIDPASGRALVVWDDDQNLQETDWDILGLLLAPDGTVASDDLLLTYVPKKQLAPRVACDPVRSRFLVVWEDEREVFGANTNREIFAQALDTEGNPLGEPLLLTQSASPYAGTAVAAHPGSGAFLVAWADRSAGDATAPDLFVRRVRPDDGTISPAVPAVIAPGEQIQPSLTYHAATDRFVLTWTDRREFPGAASLALARVLGPDGAPMSDEFDLAAGAYGTVAAALPQSEAGGQVPVVLTGWTDTARNGIYAAFFSPAAPPAPMPGVVDERPFTADGTRLGATWSTVGFATGIREYRTAVGSRPGDDDVAPWAGEGPPEEAETAGARAGLRLEEGRTYYFAVVAVGTDGQVSRVGVSPGAIVDQTPPRVEITTAPSTPLRGTTAAFAFQGHDNLAPTPLLRYRWRLDGGEWSLPSPGVTARLENLSPGDHRFDVQAIDPADNAGPPAAATFTVVP